MISKLKYILDPLDREALDRAFDEAWAAVHAKANALIESGSDEELEALLRRELMEIASFNGLDEQIVQKILSDSGLDLLGQDRSVSEQDCRGWNAYADLNAYDKDFECYRISRRTPIHLDGVQCGRRDLQVPFSLLWRIFDNWVPRRACAF